jgi:hypothetical protein
MAQMEAQIVAMVEWAQALFHPTIVRVEMGVVVLLFLNIINNLRSMIHKEPLHVDLAPLHIQSVLLNHPSALSH